MTDLSSEGRKPDTERWPLFIEVDLSDAQAFLEINLHTNNERQLDGVLNFRNAVLEEVEEAEKVQGKSNARG